MPRLQQLFSGENRQELQWRSGYSAISVKNRNAKA
jgi:hypothetical protein